MRMPLILIGALALGGSALWAQEAKPAAPPDDKSTAQAPPAKTPDQEPAEEPEAKEEEFKEEEPATPAAKMKKDELEKRACPAVDVKFTADTDKTTHPTPAPENGKGLVYIVRPTMYGNKIQTKLAVNGKWVGVNRGHNYFFLQMDPGEHYLCSKAENRSVMALKVEAGKTYYVEQKIKTGMMKARNKLAVLTDAEGQKKLAKSHPSSWAEKK